MNDVPPGHSPQDILNAQRPPDFSGSAPKPVAKKRSIFLLPAMMIVAGVAMLVLGTGPLLLTILFAYLGWTSDPNPNPVGFGILAMCTFFPSLGLIVVGGVIVAVKRAG